MDLGLSFVEDQSRFSGSIGLTEEIEEGLVGWFQFRF